MHDRSPAPLLSVVMPVYRPVAKLFREAVASVLAQTRTDFELIIVEDPSENDGLALIKDLADSRVTHIVNERRTSLPRQHNAAVARARGAYIARFDADDICEPDRLEKQLRFLEEHPDIDIVGSQLTIIDEEGTVLGIRRYPTDHDQIIRAMHDYNPLSGSNVMFRRRVVESIGGWRETESRPAQDYEWYSRAAAAGHRFANHAEALVRYRMHTGQIKSTQFRGTLETTLEVKRRYWYRTMTWRSKARYYLEHILWFVPARAVIRMAVMSRVQKKGRAA